MFTKITTYNFCTFNYDERLFGMIGQRKIITVSFQSEFLIAGEFLNIEGSDYTFPYRAHKCIKSINNDLIAKAFRSKTLQYNNHGVFIEFNDESKKFIMDFFDDILFFT